MPGTLFVVATPIGNLEDVTLRALRVLGEAKLIAAEDTRRTGTLLRHYGIDTPTTSFHEHNEQRKLPVLIARLEEGDSVAVVSDAGTPGISDPGYRLVRAAIDRGIKVEAVPGASAVLAALVASGQPTQSFSFAGFPPVKPAARARWFQELAAERRTVVFFEAPHRVRATLAAAREVLGDVQVVAGRELTKVHEELVRGTISEVLEKLEHPRGEFTVVLSPPGTHEEENATPPPRDDEILQQFGLLTEQGGGSRRAAIAGVARRLGLSAREVYAAIERAKRAEE